MMKFSENRLWIARLEKPAYQRVAIRAVKGTETSRWIFQPVLNKSHPGFVSTERQISAVLESPSTAVSESLRIWQGML